MTETRSLRSGVLRSAKRGATSRPSSSPSLDVALRPPMNQSQLRKPRARWNRRSISPVSRRPFTRPARSTARIHSSRPWARIRARARPATRRPTGWTTNSISNTLQFLLSAGTGPLFNLVDSGNSPGCGHLHVPGPGRHVRRHGAEARADALQPDDQPGGRVHADRSQRSLRVLDHHHVLRLPASDANRERDQDVDHSLDAGPRPPAATCPRSSRPSWRAACACMNRGPAFRRRKRKGMRRAFSCSA